MSAHPFPACQAEGCCVGDCPACLEIVRLRAELRAETLRADRWHQTASAMCTEAEDLSTGPAHRTVRQIVRLYTCTLERQRDFESGGSEARSQSQPASVSATPLPSRHVAPACEQCARAGLPPHHAGDLPAALGPRPCGWPDSWFDSLGGRT